MPPFFAYLDGSTQKWKRNITQKNPLHKAGLKMRTYKTLSHTQRLQIECLLKAKLPIRQIPIVFAQDNKKNGAESQ